jgi:hypothetical protein
VTADPEVRSLIDQGLTAAGRAPLTLVYYAANDAQQIAEQNVHRCLGEPSLPPSRSVEPGSARVGPGNALRHCTWAAAVTREALRTRPRGVAVAEAWGVLIAHEPEGDEHSGLLDSRLDIHNNRVGQAIAQQEFDALGADTRTLQADCRDALDRGDLVMADPAGLGQIISTLGWRSYGPNAWAGLRVDGRRPGAERAAEDQRRGQVAELPDMLDQMRASHSRANEMAVRAALEVIGEMTSAERRAALADARVGAFLEDLETPAPIRGRVRAALEAPLPSGEALGAPQVSRCRPSTR